MEDNFVVICNRCGTQSSVSKESTKSKYLHLYPMVDLDSSKSYVVFKCRVCSNTVEKEPKGL